VVTRVTCQVSNETFVSGAELLAAGMGLDFRSTRHDGTYGQSVGRQLAGSRLSVACQSLVSQSHGVPPFAGHLRLVSPERVPA
jgi:hypothetical protein